jgi:hypothetical protein
MRQRGSELPLPEGLNMHQPGCKPGALEVKTIKYEEKNNRN